MKIQERLRLMDKDLRQVTLIAVLEFHNRWMKEEEVHKAMGDFYPHVREGTDYHNSGARHMLTKDIQEINSSAHLNRIIVHSPKGIKVATEEEAMTYLHNQYKETLSKLKRIKKMEKKMESNGQYEMFDLENYIDTFIANEVFTYE